MRTETILNVFPSSDDRHRLVVAVEQEARGASRLVLRQESYSEDIGWFVQSRVPVEPEQVAGLRMSLATTSVHPRPEPESREPESREVPQVPAILPFTSAAG